MDPAENVAPLRRPLSDEMTEKLAAARADRAEADREQRIEDELTLERVRSRVEALPKRAELGTLAPAVVNDILTKLLDGRIKIKTAAEAKAVGEWAYNMTRLEAGENLTGGAMSREDAIAAARAAIEERRKATSDPDAVKAERDRQRRAVRPPTA